MASKTLREFLKFSFVRPEVHLHIARKFTLTYEEVQNGFKRFKNGVQAVREFLKNLVVRREVHLHIARKFTLVSEEVQYCF